MRRLHKTMQRAYFCVHLSEGINRRSPIIEKQYRQNIVRQVGVYRNIFTKIFMD